MDSISFRFCIPLLGFGILVSQQTSQAYELNDKLSINAILAAAYQYQVVDPDDDLGRGAVPAQLEFSFAPTPLDMFAAKFGFAAGNGLNGQTAFVLAPWAADLEDDVQDINGSGRDYLLTAWYEHSIDFMNSDSLALSGGIIDATDYLDENAYANDEYTQYMNEALVNGPNAFLPSYDVGGAFRFHHKDVDLSGVLMHVDENEYDNSYNFYGLQVGYTLDTTLGTGNYRLLLGTTGKEFLDPAGLGDEDRKCLLLSFDQELGGNWGAWLRLGTQDDAAAIIYKNIYSGGIYISGDLWGRENDNAGLGYAYLDGGNSGLNYTQIAEAYTRFALNDYLAFTMDIQYMNDRYDTAADYSGFIFGIRAAAEF